MDHRSTVAKTRRVRLGKGFATEFLVALAMITVVAVFLLVLALAQPAVWAEPVDSLSAHYAPNCEAIDALSAAPDSALARWYAGQPGEGHLLRINCMGR
jgi:hypothetical protein